MYVQKLNDDYKITIFVMKSVKNIAALKPRVISGVLNCCVVKANLVLDAFQIITAAKKAVENKAENRLTTKSLNSEVLFNLSISKNITQSLNTFGIGDNDKDYVVCVIGNINYSDAYAKDLVSEIDGEVCSVEELAEIADKQLLAEVYKIKEAELGVSTLLDSILTRIATKDFGSHS